MSHFKDLFIRGIKAKESTKTILAHLVEALDETRSNELYRSRYQTSQVYSPLEELGVKLGNLDLSSRRVRVSVEDRVTELDGRLDTSVLFQANLRSRISDLESKFAKLETPCPQTPTQANPFETEEDCEAELEDLSKRGNLTQDDWHDIYHSVKGHVGGVDPADMDAWNHLAARIKGNLDKSYPPEPNIWCCKDRPFKFTFSHNIWVCTGCKRKFLSRSV